LFLPQLSSSNISELLVRVKVFFEWWLKKATGCCIVAGGLPQFTCRWLLCPTPLDLLPAAAGTSARTSASAPAPPAKSPLDVLLQLLLVGHTTHHMLAPIVEALTPPV
jgi:hypothetical protein